MNQFQGPVPSPPLEQLEKIACSNTFKLHNNLTRTGDKFNIFFAQKKFACKTPAGALNLKFRLTVTKKKYGFNP